MQFCGKHLDCSQGEYCLQGGICGGTTTCTRNSQCNPGFGCHNSIKLCVPLACTSDVNCPPHTHLCDLVTRACQPRLPAGRPCSEDATCLPDLLCHQSVCRQSCGPSNACRSPAICTAITDSRHVCLSPAAGAVVISSFAASGGGSEAEGRGQSETGSEWNMFIILAFGMACLLFLCLLLFLAVTLLSAKRRRSNLETHKRDRLDTTMADMEDGRTAPGPNGQKPSFPVVKTSSTLESGEIAPRPQPVATAFVMPKLRPIKEETSTSPQWEEEESVAGVDPSLSPNVQSAKALWEGRGRLISSTIPTSHIPGSAQLQKENAGSQVKGRSQSRSRSRSRSRDRDRGSSEQQELQF